MFLWGMVSSVKAMSKSVCIIGAGPSGLVAAKTLLHNAPKGEFRVTIFDIQEEVGGLWPTSLADDQRQVHPLMVANQSRHTMHFSDYAWEENWPQIPLGWQVGQYLKRYQERYLSGHEGFSLELGTRVASAVLRDGPEYGWNVVLRKGGAEETKPFDYVLVASGFFGKPIIPECLSPPKEVPIVHSSAYRDLESLLSSAKPGGGKILVIGGQMSGVEIAGTIGTHLSSAMHSPESSKIPDIDKYSIHHVIQRPIWVFPLYTSPEPSFSAAPFLPFDFPSYNLNRRPHPLANSQGHISQEVAKLVNGIFETTLGNDQSPFSSQLHINEERRTEQPYLAASDWYCELVRSGLITLTTGKVESLQGTTATITPGNVELGDVAAVVVATGFDASPWLDFLPKGILSTLHHSPRHVDQPVALAFHGTHHPQIPRLGFVGFYRSPYWGVMQMQARFLARFWSGSKDKLVPARLDDKLRSDDSIERTLGLRDDPRVSQFPMGDYPFLMQEFAEALGLTREPPATAGLPELSVNNQPLDMLTPSRYIDTADDDKAREEAVISLKSARDVTLSSLTTPRFVARAVFRSLLGTWKLERDLVSKLPSHPSGHFSGTARFLLREATLDGLQCVSNDGGSTGPGRSRGLEYLYIEEGEFKTDLGFGFKASRRYVWRYDEDRDVLSQWFVKPDDEKRVDYLFHEIKFLQPDDREKAKSQGWQAQAGHLCIDDFYNVKYDFSFEAVNLKQWSIGYTVKGPKKDYSISGTYTR
ncbi:unnamed protein product [Clonostachys rhizophaga]|uniref:DUF6314 domain-containing protein n=1 Tax=Clonostachys rhizophaga TaxID=160324 RepID=A0A9N9V7H0_9HYPO|nr:unnamed protein product [Clonostachys rhizophaga]